jgi:hypothetical protein
MYARKSQISLEGGKKGVTTDILVGLAAALEFQDSDSKTANIRDVYTGIKESL